MPKRLFIGKIYFTFDLTKTVNYMELLQQYYDSLNKSKRFEDLNLCEKKELFDSIGFAYFKIEVFTKEAQDTINRRLKILRKYKNDNN